MQGEPVVLIADQRLGLFSVGDLQHVHGQVELRELLRRVLLVLNLERNKGTKREFKLYKILFEFVFVF